MTTLFWRACVSVFLAALSLSVGAQTQENTETITIHYLGMTRELPDDKIVQATIVALQNAVPNIRIRTKIENFSTLQDVYKANPEDYFVVTSGFFWERLNDGSAHIATLTTPLAPYPNEGVAGAFVTRKDRTDLDSVESLKGKRAVLTDQRAFMNSAISMGEIARRGFDPGRFFSRIFETGRPMRKCLEAVDKGQADVALVRAGLIESLKASGDPLVENLHVIDLKKSDHLSYAHTSKAYPGWTFMAGPDASPYVTRDLTVALLTLPQEDIWGGQWLPTTDFSSISELYKDLKMGPYAYLKSWTVSRVWAEYKLAVVVFVLLVCFAVFHSWRNAVLIRKRTAELKVALVREEDLNRRANEAAARINELQKTSVVGLFSSIIAHDLLQPLSASKYYLQALKTFLLKGETQKALPLAQKAMGTVNRSVELVSKIRNYAKNPQPLLEEVEVKARLKHTIAELREAKQLVVEPDLSELADMKLWMDPFEFDVMTVHLLENAMEAVRDIPAPKRFVRIQGKVAQSRAILKFENSGQAIDRDRISSLTAPLQSTKREGLGLGLPIVVILVERFGGVIHITANDEKIGGLTISMDFPVGNIEGEAVESDK